MNFTASFSLGLCSFFIGTAFGCVLCLIFSKIFHKKHLKCRVSVLLVSLSLAVAFATIFAVFAQEKCDVRQIFSISQNVIFFVSLFAFGTLVSSLWKFLLLPFFVAYLLLFFHTQNFLKSRFSDVANIPVTIESPEVNVNLKIYELPVFLLLPARRFYFEVEISGSDVAKENHVEKISEKKSEEKENAFHKWILRDERVVPVEIPPSRIYPALYLLNLRQTFDEADFSLSRTL